MPTRTQQSSVVVIPSNPPEAWRFTCPNGHTTWSRCNDHWHCPYCARAAERGVDVDPEFDALLDQKTGRRLTRDDVQFQDVPL